MSKETYIYYSGATDITGKKLQEALSITGGKTKPTNKKLVIGWGTKIDKDTAFPPDVHVLNHPNNIRANRNKFKALTAMMGAKVNVAPFVTAETVISSIGNKKGVNLPLVGRTNFHQGGKGFWLCITNSMVDNAIREGAQYFQEFIDIKDEYRLHVFSGDLLYGQKKVKRTNMEEAFVEQNAEKIESMAGKNNKSLDKDTMSYTLGRLAKNQSSPDMIIRSNTRGWKFSHITKVSNELVNEAAKALEAVGLDFGAVDCCVDTDGKVWILEINSGPGLKETPFTAYVDRFKKAMTELLAPPKPASTKTVAAQSSTPPIAKSPASSDNRSITRVKDKLSVMNKMAEMATEDEAKSLESLFDRMFDK